MPLQAATSAGSSRAAASPGSPNPATFAGVLAALTARHLEPLLDEPDPEPAWLDDLGEDVSLLSYERALKTHGPRRSVAIAGLPPLPAVAFCQAGSTAGAPDASRQAERPAGDSLDPPAFRPGEDRRKLASVTVRISRAEFGQLQRRSAEAGMTVSAYLRSCAFEVDSLRAQVKQALADLRTAQLAAQPPPPSRRWWARFLLRERGPQSALSA